MDIKTIHSGDSNFASSTSGVSAPSNDEQMRTNVTKDVITNNSIQNNGAEADSGQDEITEQKQPSDGTMKQAVSDINKRLKNTECVFGIHEATNRVMIQIIDKDTKEVIKEYPPEKTLDLFAKALELAGLLVDEKL